MRMLCQMADSEAHFYSRLDSFSDFSAFTDQENYHYIPASWYVVITDIKGSTQAIKEGKYREVNALGAASIAALLNAVAPLDIPYVFGGDGATFCIPPGKKQAVESALLAAKQMAVGSFSLELRVGLVPVRDILDAGYRVMVGKYHPSAHYNQAMFLCSGLGYAEKLVKDPRTDNHYLLDENKVSADASFEGFECRWNQIPSAQEESVAILVRVLTQDEEAQIALYNEIYASILDIYGREDRHHPVHEDQLQLTLSPLKLMTELRIRTFNKLKLSKLAYLMKLLLSVMAGMWLMKKGIETDSVDWGKYKSMLIHNTDYRKFDELLRLVISGTRTQRKQLQEYLDRLHMEKKIVFGIHASRYALMTCLVFNYENQHVHFLDAADGGYALAAQKMKHQLKAVESSTADDSTA